VKAEIEAINKGQVDVASSYFSDDAQMVTSIGQPKGKEKIRTFVINLIQMKEHDDIANLAVDGTNVTGRMTLTNTALQATPVSLKAVVQDGKIVSWEEGSAAK
jgi:ketosteroid isomerase-like protein